MFEHLNKLKFHEVNLYNKILLLSRNKFLYTEFNLEDTFQNRINLIFFYSSFLIIKFKKIDNNSTYKSFSQKFFDHIFIKIEINLREIGFGDTKINKDLKKLIKLFYTILLECENYNTKTIEMKKALIHRHLTFVNNNKSINNEFLVNYFDKYQTFCLDLSPDSVLKGDINFKFN